MTQQTAAPAAAAPSPADPTSGAPKSAEQAATQGAPTSGDPATSEEFKSPESKSAVLADLAKERDARQALEQRIAATEEATATRNKALAEALGLTEPPKSEDALAETVKNLQEQFAASQRETLRLQIAANPGVDAEGKPLPAIPPEFHNLLTETDPEKLRAQAVTVSALVAANAAAGGTPAFQPNPGQGQGGQPTKSEADKDYEALFGPQS